MSRLYYHYATPIGLERTYRILFSIVCTFYMENDAVIFPAHYTWKVAEKGFLDGFYDE
jgi:hypothetical protein